MASKRDYYEVLGLSRGASEQDIKSAYRKLAVEHHPDRNPGDAEAEERFKEAAEAYAVLSDPEKRSRYDRFGHQQGPVGGFGGFDPDIFGDFSDILGDFFGFGGGRRRGRGRSAVHGADLRYDLNLSFMEAAFGCEPTLRIPRLETCGECTGTGSADRGGPDTCSTCAGHGQVRFTQGFFTVARTCPKCGGSGTVIANPCGSCGGQGRREEEHALQVKIPAGVETGSRLRLPGEGEHGTRGGVPGDLYVVIHVDQHEIFERRGADVWSRLAISYPQAVLGAEIDVDTVHGTAQLQVPPGTHHGDTLSLRGKGVSRLDGRGQGDHHFAVVLDVPKARDLPPEELELIEELARRSGEAREERGVLDRVKDLFA